MLRAGHSAPRSGQPVHARLTSATRCGVVAIVASVVLLWAGGARAQDTPDPSALLPMETHWTTALEDTPAAAPVHEAGRVFVPLRDGQVVAVTLADGALIWKVASQVVGQPAVGGGLLYLATRDQLHGLEVETGQTRWSIPLETPLSAPLVWNAGWLIAALDAETLLALRGETGETIWHQAMGGAIHRAPSLAGDRMYVSLDNGGVVALSLMTGDAEWEQRLAGAPSEILPLDDLFVGAADNHFYRLSRVDGSIKWRWATGGDIVGLPAVDEKRVYFSSLDNMLWALNRSNGVQQWRRPLAVRPTGGPSRTSDLLVLGGMSEDLTFFDPIEGVSYGRITAPSELAFPPLSVSTPADGPLLITVTRTGQLRALRRATGPVRLELAATAIPGTSASDVDDDPTATTATAPSPAAVDAGAPPQPRRLVGGEYAIQVGAFSERARAIALVDSLIEDGYPAYAIEPQQAAPPLYRVRIGDYPDRPAAEATGRQVEDNRELDWYVVVLP